MCFRLGGAHWTKATGGLPISFRYRGAPVPVLDRVSLYVRSGDIAAVVGAAVVDKTTLLRYVGRRSDGQSRVFLGSEIDESGRKPGGGPG